MFSKLKMMTLKERIEYRKCTLVYKAQNSLGPQFRSDTTVSEVHCRNTSQLVIATYMYPLVVTKKCTGKGVDTVVP